MNIIKPIEIDRLDGGTDYKVRNCNQVCIAVNREGETVMECLDHVTSGSRHICNQVCDE